MTVQWRGLKINSAAERPRNRQWWRELIHCIAHHVANSPKDGMEWRGLIHAINILHHSSIVRISNPSSKFLNTYVWELCEPCREFDLSTTANLQHNDVNIRQVIVTTTTRNDIIKTTINNWQIIKPQPQQQRQQNGKQENSYAV